jgi:hypothetical protein
MVILARGDDPQKVRAAKGTMAAQNRAVSLGVKGGRGLTASSQQLRTAREVHSIHCNDRKQSNTTHEMPEIVHRLA